MNKSFQYFLLGLVCLTAFGVSGDMVLANAATSIGLPANTLMTQGDQKLLFGGCSSDLWTYLKAHATAEADKGGGRSLVPRPGETGIQSGLACRLYTFFKYMETKGCKPQIISAFRSAGVQSQICGPGGKASGCAAPGRSCHQYGAAVDVGGCAEKMRKELTSILGKSRFKLHFPYYGPHIQCLEHTCASARCCGDKNKQCAGGAPIDFDQIPHDQNGSGSPSASGSQNQDPASQLAQNLNSSDPANGVTGSGGSSGGSSNPSYAGVQDIFSEPVTPQSPTISPEEKQTLFDCLLDDFGKCNEDQKETVQALLEEGNWEGAIEGEEGYAGGEGEDTLSGSGGNDALGNSAQACAEGTVGIGRNDAACLRVTSGGATEVLPVSGVGGASVNNTIRDEQNLGTQIFGALGQTPPSNGEAVSDTTRNQYLSFEYYRGSDMPSSVYFDEQTQTYRYRSSGAEVPSGLVDFVFSRDDSALVVPSIFSWETLRTAGATVFRAALPSFGVTLPFASFFSF